MAKEREKGNKFIEAIEELHEKQNKALEYILLFAAARKEGMIEGAPIQYNFDTEFADLIINTLADMVIHYHFIKKPKKERDKNILKHKSFEPVFKSIKPEIEKIFSAIKQIGFSGRLIDEERKWQEAALNGYDDSRKGFHAIKREYLEDKKIYEFTIGQERRSFERGILKKIMDDTPLGKYGSDVLREVYKEVTNDPK